MKSVQQNWIKKLQENIKVKVSEVNHELILSGAVKKELTVDTVSLYTLLIEKEGRVHMTVFVKTDSIFFSPEEDKSALASDKTDNNIINYIRSFAVEQYRLAVADELALEQKKQKDLESDLSKLVKENESLNKEISTLENNIEKTERSITDIDREIELKNQEMTSHRTSMLTLVLEDDKKAAQEKDKGLEKEKNKLEKDRSKAKNDISDMKAKIEKNNKAIKENEKNQEEKKTEISAQKEAVARVQTILNGIR